MKLASLAVLSLLFLSLFVPTSYVEIKAILLTIASLALAFSYLSRETFVSKKLFLGTVFITAFGFLFSLYGSLNGNPGAIRVLTLWVLWPIIYLIFSSLLVQPDSYLWIAKTFIYAFVSVVLYGFLYLGYVAGLVPDEFYFELNQGQDVGFHDGYIEFRLHSIASLIFLLAFYIHYNYEVYKRSSHINAWALILIVAAIILSFLTGRKAVLLSLILLPIVIFFSNKLLNNRKRFRVGVILPFVLAFAAIIAKIVLSESGLIFDNFLKMFISGFEFLSGDESATDRRLMFIALIDGWINNSILFGAGNGAVADFVSSPEMPWAYELTYVYLLFTTGLIGVILLFGWYAYSLLCLRRAILKRPDLVLYAGPMLTGSIIFCVAASTNPYFSKFDFLWIVMLPFLISGWTKFQSFAR